MTKLKNIFVFFILLPVSYFSYSDNPNPCEPLKLTYNDVLCRIESENLSVLLNREKIEEALQFAFVERSALFPQINFTTTQSRSRFFTSFGTVSFGGIVNRFDGALEGSFSILDLKKISDFKVAQKGYHISKINYEALLQEVLTQAARAFLLHLRNIKRMEVLNANIERDAVLLDLASSRFNAGVASPIDVTRAEVQLARDHKEKLLHQNTLNESEHHLKLLLNIDPDTPLEIISPDNIYQDAPKPNAHNHDICLALEQRKDFISAKEELEKKYMERHASGADRIPKVNFSGSYGCSSLEAFDGLHGEVWRLGLNVSMPIFDGLKISSDKRRISSQIRGQKFLIRDLQNTIHKELTLNKKNMQSFYDQIDIAQTQVKLGEKELELAKLRFQEGLSGNQEIIDAQTNLSEFSDQLINTVYLYNLTRLEWARAMGNVRMLCLR